ncbi:MAG: twin transmembrane helix small protein [Alphaproteobacteria bacterium]
MTGGQILVAIALAAVAIVLIAGISTMFIGGEFSRKWSNRLMRYRVLAQFIAIVIIMAVLYFGTR